MKEYGTNDVEGVLSTIHQNYFAQLCELDNEEMKNIEIAAVGAGLGSWFDHTSKLMVMKLKEVMNGLDNDKWNEEIENKVMNDVWEPLHKKDLLEGAKVITSTWACKKKRNGTYLVQLNARKFKQVAGKHFNPS